MKTAIITNIDRKKKFFLQKTAANEILTLIHQESCHLFSKNFRVCEPIKTEKLGSSSCLPEIFFKEKNHPLELWGQIRPQPKQ